MALRTGNPTLRDSTFAVYRGGAVSSTEAKMTLDGTVHRTFFLLCLVVAAASVTWGLLRTDPGLSVILMFAGLIGGLITCLVTCFKKAWSPVSAPIYAVFEGLALGGISAMYEAQYNGIVFQAIVLTFGTLFALLAAYRSGLIKPSENFKLGLMAAMGGILVTALVTIGMQLAGFATPAIHGNGPIGIVFSLVVVVVASLNFVLDFDFIEQGVEYGAPKYMEWYAAFGLLVTLVWLYLEILRLLSKLRSRD